MTQAKHTPTPFIVGDRPGKIYDNFGQSCANTYVNEKTEKEARDNAEFIVRACNAHDELLAALEKALDTIEGMKQMLNSLGAAYGIGLTVGMAKDAIAKAKGEM